jgi:alpha-galactosidase
MHPTDRHSSARSLPVSKDERYQQFQTTMRSNETRIAVAAQMSSRRSKRLNRCLLAIVIVSITGFSPTRDLAALENNLARTPPMGWNSWNWWGKQNINETIVSETIDALANKGLRDAGYTYVVIDGGWRATRLNPDGSIPSHPTRFPGGIRRLADKAHAAGLKFGLHTVPGFQDCGGDPIGGYQHEKVQIQQFVSWGIDYLKLDACGSPAQTQRPNEEAYSLWRDLLQRSGRPILFSMSVYRWYDWYPATGNLGRTTGDIASHSHGGALFDGAPRKSRLGFMTIAEINNQFADHARPGYWNDPDSLVVGDPALSLDEQQTHFALWAVMTAPLMLGNDPRNMSTQERQLILNRGVIAIDQDPTEQGRLIRKFEGGGQVWAKRLADGSRAVLLINADSRNRNVGIQWQDLALPDTVNAMDVLGQRDLGMLTAGYSASLPPHACRLLKVSSATAPPRTSGSSPSRKSAPAGPTASRRPRPNTP